MQIDSRDSGTFREAVRPSLLSQSIALVVKASPNINGHWGTFRQLLLLWRQSFYVLLKQVFSLYNRFLFFIHFHDTKKVRGSEKKVVVNKCCAALSIALLANLFYRALALLHFVPTLKSRYELSPQRKIKFTFLPILIA